MGDDTAVLPRGLLNSSAGGALVCFSLWECASGEDEARWLGSCVGGLRYAGALECDCFHEAIRLFNAERPPAATFREGTSGPGGRKAPKNALVAGRVRCPSAEFSSSRPAPKGRERECRPFINRALHEPSGSCAMEGWMLAASTVFIIRVGRVENPIRAPDKRLNNSEQNLKMERSARALCTLMIGFRPWI